MSATKYLRAMVDALLAAEAHKATKYLSDREVVTVTRRLYGGRIPRRARTVDIVLKIGAPNFSERKFIAAAKKAGEPFPIKKVQLRFPPKRRAKR